MTQSTELSISMDQGGQGTKTLAPFCGIVMPIATMSAEYDAAHWKRVKEVIDSAIIQAKYTPRLVSDSNEIGVIHARIVQNLYDDEVVVVDFSNKNPNVMFELGLRLAFDKPTIVVKDDLTAYTFDAGVIEHIQYRYDQRFDDVELFRNRLCSAISSTVEAKRRDPTFSPFLKHFGTFTPKLIENHEVPQADYIMRKLTAIEDSLEGFAYDMAKLIGAEFDGRRSLTLHNEISKLDHTGDIRRLIHLWLDMRKIRISDANMAKDDCYKFLFEKFNGVLPPSRFAKQFEHAWSEEIGVFG